MAHDLVIRNAVVVDGTGAPRRPGAVAVDGGRIVAVGDVDGRGTHEIDADGLVVAPGFIDGHTHLDAQICWDPLGTCDSWHGVTTVVMGNCGFTVAPVRRGEEHLALRSLERAEDIAAEVLAAGVEWRWSTFREYLDVVDALPKGINVAGYVGHSALRPFVMGEAAFERAATDDELAAMAREVDDAMRAGAIGLSTSRSRNHATTTDGPVASRVADWREVETLVGVLARLRGGIFQLAQEQYDDPTLTDDYRERLLALARASGRPTLFTVGFSADAAEAHRAIAYLERARTAGAAMTGTVHTRAFASTLGFRVRLPFDHLPTWAPVRALPLDEQARQLRDPAVRARLVDEAMHGPYRSAIGAEARPPQWDRLCVVDSPLGPWRSLASLAQERATTPADVLIDLSLDAGFDVYFSQPFANLDPDGVLALLRSPDTVIGISDTGAHVGQLLDSSITTHLLAHWVRERGEFTLETGVRMLTADPARVWGFADRGVIAEGYAGDLVLFDPDTVGPGMPDTRYDQPGGVRRLVQPATGVHATIVAGQVVLRDGEPTGALPGRLVRGPVAGR